jgi:hypothetical protein
MASINLKGDTSGEIQVIAPAVAGTNTLTLPAETGTIVTTAASVYVKLVRTATQAYTTGLTEDVVFNQTVLDSHSLVTGGNTFVVTAATAGQWFISATVRFSADPTRAICSILVNSGDVAKNDTRGRGPTCNTIITLNSGDIVKVSAFQNSGGNLNTVGDTISNQLTAYRL